MSEKFIVWIFFTVIVSIIPLILDRIGGNTKTWNDFWSNGQLLLIGIALGAEANGTFLSAGLKYTSPELTVLGSNFIIVMTSCFFFDKCNDIQKRQQLIIPANFVCPLLFTLSLILSFMCKYLIIKHGVG